MKRKKQPQIPKTKKLTKQSFNKEKGITLIALVITIIVLIILAGISINSVLGGNGLFKRVQSASVDTKKAKVIEDAKIAYLEVYIEKAEKSDSNTITIGDVVSRLKSGYGYTDEQIVMVSSVVTDITLSETEVTLKPGETKDVIVTLENGTYYALIEGLYYPITLSNDGITLGEGIANLPEGEETTDTIEAKATLGSDLVDVIVNETTITITAKEGQAGKVTIIVTYGGIKKEIIATIIWEVKQGDEVPLGSVSVMVNGIQRTLDQGWKYFYNDEDSGKVWLIYSEIIEGVAQQISGTISILGNGVYSYSSRQDLIDYLNGTGNYKGSWDHIKIGIITALSAKKITIGETR